MADAIARAGPLHPRIEELLEHLDETRAAFVMAVAAVPPARRTGRPAKGRWSLGELVDHMHKVESGFLRLLSQRVAQARERGAAPERESSSIFGMLDSSIGTDRTRRIDAPPTVVPTEGASVERGLAALVQSRIAVRAALVDASGIALGSLTHAHPVFGTLDMYQWGLLLGWHDLRHAAQVREMSSADTRG